jgi:hypothetical protein
MNTQASDAARRVRAWTAGKPLPHYETKHVHLAGPSDALIVAFVRMGGESAPWAVAIGHPDSDPTVLSVPEARDRDLVAQMVAEIAPTLLAHFRHPEFDGGRRRIEDSWPFRQLWLPNATHLEMLHHLAYSYSFAKWGDATRAALLRKLGALAGWLFREANRPGQQTVLVGSGVLKDAYVFPSDPVREAHLGYLLAWLRAKGGRETRLRAAMEAEQLTVATTLDPSLEREELDESVERWKEAEKTGSASRARSYGGKIRGVLADEVLRRFRLTADAFEYFRADSRRTNTGVAKLIQGSQAEHWYQFARMQLRTRSEEDGPAFILSPETDRSPAAAASRYYIQQASEEYRLSVLLADDSELLDETIAAGDAIHGKIVEVWDEGDGCTRPVWRLEFDHDAPLRIREGSSLCVAGLPSRTVRVREIEWLGPVRISITVDVTGLLTVPRRSAGFTVRPAADSWYEGKEVTLVPQSFDGLSRRKSQRAWERDTPGAWLTHATGNSPAAELPTEVAEDLATALQA